MKATKKAKSLQQLQVDALLDAANESSDITSVYRNKEGQILVATEYERGLSRAVVSKDGSIKSLGSGPVDESKWVKAFEISYKKG